MNSIQSIFQKYGRKYRQGFGTRIPARHLKAMADIEGCRTDVMGKGIFKCPDCSEQYHSDLSCGNRHCPTCQGDKSLRWLGQNGAALLPTAYFMVTFTMPEEMHTAARANQRIVYNAFFASAFASMLMLAKNPKYLNANIGALAVLHTWGDELQYHPHIHFLVPAGGLDEEKQWKGGRQDFFLPVMALSEIVRAKMRDALRKEDFFSFIASSVWANGWNVHCENVGNGERALRYLARYLFRVAISPERIMRYDEDTVTFRRKKKLKGKEKNMTLRTDEFIRRFLTHILPKGFVKVRRYGFLAINAKVDLEKLQKMCLGGFELPEETKILAFTARKISCKSCGSEMVFVRVVRGHIGEHAMALTG